MESFQAIDVVGFGRRVWSCFWHAGTDATKFTSNRENTQQHH